MAAIDLNELNKKYKGFFLPKVKVYLGGADPEEDKKARVRVANFVVELTSDLKASIATFSIINAFSPITGAFDVKSVKKYIMLGLDVRILMGHDSEITEVFVGYISGVDFVYNSELAADSEIRITAMDVKGIMMANNSSKRLKANYYSDAVKEILNGDAYQNLTNSSVIRSITVSDTPDKPPGGAAGETPDNRIEMVAESDYDFVVKAAKRFNYEFFSIGGNIAFRAAKANTQVLAEIYPSNMIVDFDVGYNITGVVGQVTVRTLDIGKAKKIEVKKKNANKFSLGSKAKPLISSQNYVYMDSSIESQDEATNRAAYIMEDMSYRLGTIKMTLNGMPEFVPGRFIELKDFGDGVSNRFYITDVIHEYSGKGKYTTTIEGKASTL